jgi:lipid-A-disaccharide synthase
VKSIYIIAGEPSGDAIGAIVIRRIRQEEPDVEIIGIGGPKMVAEGMSSLFDICEISVGGILEIVPHLRRIILLINQTIHDIFCKKPDVVITIDSPGFSFRVIREVKKLIPNTIAIHLVAPSVWAWRSNRVKKVAKLYDALLTLFDFEPKYFESSGLKTIWVGHPIVESIPEETIDYAKKEDIVLLMPGSRYQEIMRLLPIFLEAGDKIGAGRYVIPSLPHLTQLITKLIGSRNVSIIVNEEAQNEMYRKAKLAIVASGTATVQLALARCPMIVCYKLNCITFGILKMFVKAKYVSLVNIILDKKIVPELLQNECTADNIVREVNSTNFREQFDAFCNMKNRLMSRMTAPSKIIVDYVLGIIGNSKRKI